MIANVTSLLAGHLASGGLFVAAMLALFNKVPDAFLKFCTTAAMVSALGAAMLGSGPLRWAFVVVAVAAAAWNVALRKGRSSRAIALGVGVTAMASPALVAFRAAENGSGLAFAGSASSSLLLGAVTVTMILGHWYLVDTSLSIAPLRSGARWFWIAVLSRVGVIALVLAYGGFEVLRVSRFADVIFSTTGLFFFFRSIMGLIAPLLLAGLIWQTVKIRSTQSATGLLYVALILVLFGELVSQFLLVTTGYPL